MGCLTQDFVFIVNSLAKEYNKSLKDFIPIQINFIENAKFNTDFCNKSLKNNKEEIIKKLKEML